MQPHKRFSQLDVHDVDISCMSPIGVMHRRKGDILWDQSSHIQSNQERVHA